MNKSRTKPYIKLYKSITFKHLVWVKGITRQDLSHYKNQTGFTGEKKATKIEKNINEAVAFMKEYDSLKFKMTDKIRVDTASYFLAIEYNEFYPVSNAEAEIMVRKLYDSLSVHFKKMLIKFVIKKFKPSE